MITTRSGVAVLNLTLLALLGTASSGACQTRRHGADRFKEANAKWALYESTYLPKLQGSVRGGKTDGTVKFHFEVKNTLTSSLHIVEAILPEGRRHEATAVNARYTFSLNKKEGGWILAKLALDPTQNVSPTGQPVRGLIFERAAEQFMVSALPLPELFNHRSFSIGSVKNLTTEDGLAVVRIEFSFKPYLKKEPIMYVALESGTVTLVPSQFWRVLECEVIHKYSNGIKYWKGSYDVDLIDGVPILKTARVTTRSPRDNGEVTEEEYLSTCDLRLKEGVPEVDFYLTAFDLPEPVGIIPPARSRSWLWISLAAVVILCVAISFRTLKRRNGTQAPEPVKE